MERKFKNLTDGYEKKEMKKDVVVCYVIFRVQEVLN